MYLYARSSVTSKFTIWTCHSQDYKAFIRISIFLWSVIHSFLSYLTSPDYGLYFSFIFISVIVCVDYCIHLLHPSVNIGVWRYHSTIRMKFYLNAEALFIIF